MAARGSVSRLVRARTRAPAPPYRARFRHRAWSPRPPLDALAQATLQAEGEDWQPDWDSWLPAAELDADVELAAGAARPGPAIGAPAADGEARLVTLVGGDGSRLELCARAAESCSNTLREMLSDMDGEAEIPVPMIDGPPRAHASRRRIRTSAVRYSIPHWMTRHVRVPQRCLSSLWVRAQGTSWLRWGSSWAGCPNGTNVVRAPRGSGAATTTGRPRVTSSCSCGRRLGHRPTCARVRVRVRMRVHVRRGPRPSPAPPSPSRMSSIQGLQSATQPG